MFAADLLLHPLSLPTSNAAPALVAATGAVFSAAAIAGPLAQTDLVLFEIVILPINDP
ncbi:MAG: hypothetical protein ABSH20_23030 [Tepidisphaeraceae bacterium]